MEASVKRGRGGPVAKDPAQEKLLGAKARLLELLRDPANLRPVRQFCQILWQGLRGEKEARLAFIHGIARGGFPEGALEAEEQRRQAREKTARVRRLKRLVAI